LNSISDADSRMRILTSKLIIWPALLLVLSLLGGAAYIIVIPPWQSPDEPTHFEYVRVLRDGDSFFSPRPDPALQQEIIASLDEYDYWRYVGVERPIPLPEEFSRTPFLSYAPSQVLKNPPLYYLIASLILKCCPARELIGQMYRLRTLSLIFSLATVVMVFAAARLVFAGRLWPSLAAAGFVAFLPQFMVIGTSVSPDPLLNFLGASVVYQVLKNQKTGWRIAGTVSMLILSAAGILVSYKFLILIPALFLAWFVYYLFRGIGPSAAVRFLTWCGLALVIIAVGYSFLAWNHPDIARIYVIRLSRLSSIVSDYCSGRTRVIPHYWNWFRNELFKSFWLKFGWLRFEFSPVLYAVLKVASALSLAGLAAGMIKWIFGNSLAEKCEKKFILTLIAYAVSALGAYFLFWGLKGEDTTTQGRHLFLVLPAWAILFIWGWKELFPSRWEKRACLVLLLCFILLDAVALIGYVIPAF